MKRYLILLFTIFMTSLCLAQEQKSLKIYQGDNVYKYILSNVDSITHNENLSVDIHKNGVVNSFGIESIDSIKFFTQKNDLYVIDKHDLDEWDEGYALCNNNEESSSLYMLGKYNQNEDNYILHFNKFQNSKAEDGVTFYLDSEKRIQTFFVNSLCYTSIISDDNIISYVGINKNGEIADSFSLAESSINTHMRKAASSIIDGINAILDIESVPQILDHFSKSEYGEVVLSIGSEAIVGALKLDPKRKLVTKILIDALNKLYFNQIKKDFYDDCTPQIVNITHDKVTVNIANVENLRDWCYLEFSQLGTSKKVYLVVAIGNDKNGYVTYSNCKWKTSLVQIDKGTSTIDVAFPTGIKIGTYYLRPLLITNQVLDKKLSTVKEWYIQYGGVEVFKYPNIKLKNIKQNSCKFYENENEYSVEFTIDGEIDCLEEVKEWGVKVYNQKGDIEKEIATSSNKSAYSFKYQDFVSGDVFDKNIAEFIIVPFAKGSNKDEIVFCEPRTFVVKYSLSPSVSTGSASASFTEAKCRGAVSFNDETITNLKSSVDECGFFYNLTGNPHYGTSAKQICNLENDGQFNGTISGLTEDTKYYYAAFVRIGNDYYYGETKVFKTQKKNNPNPNPDPDPNPEIEPNAITGGHYKETTTTATIECTYENVPSDADCGYFLDEESNSTSVGISMNRSLGYVEGKQVIPLSGLKPGKTYYYQAYIKHDGKSYLGSEQSFKTKELNPIAKTGGCSDVTDKSAIVECSFEDVPEGGKCYVLLQWVDNGEYKMITYGANEGKNLKISCSGLKPATTYYYTAAISYNGKEYVGEEKSFTTDFPDLSGTWTFNQDYYGDKTISANLVYKSSGDGCVIYKASGFYGVNSMECTFSADRTIYIYCYGPYGYTGSFSGKINDDFTSASGDSYYYGTPSWANPGWTVEKPWSFSR